MFCLFNIKSKLNLLKIKVLKYIFTLSLLIIVKLEI